MVDHVLDDMAGGFFELNRGVDAPQVLFTVDVRGVRVGETTATAGPDTDIYGVDILLAETSDAQIIYGLGPTITVSGRPPPMPGEIPEPHSVLLIALALWGVTLRLRRRVTRQVPNHKNQINSKFQIANGKQKLQLQGSGKEFPHQRVRDRNHAPAWMRMVRGSV